MSTLPNRLPGLTVGILVALLAWISPVSAQDSESTTSTADFWPKRLDADTTSLLYVQLAAAERQPVGRLECSSGDFELGPATWSHNLGYLHAFDLEFTAPRMRTNCLLRVTGHKGKEYVGQRTLALRKRVAQVSVRSVAPDVAVVGHEVPVEVQGTGFGAIVDVVWIATDRNESFSRTVRSADATKGTVAVVPFVPGTTDAGAGEYLVVVENDDNAAAIYADHFVVEDEADPEVVRSSLEEFDGQLWVTIEGFGLSGLQVARLGLPTGDVPLQLVKVEGMAMETVRVALPPESVKNLAFSPELLIEERELTVRLERCSRLSQCTSELPPSRD
jgi:hypothetical protein